MKKSIYLLVLIIVMLGSVSLKANIKLPAILSDNMVMQRNTTVKLWGWADKGEKINIKVGWLPNAIHTVASDEGKWLVSIKTTDAGGPYTIDIEGKNKISLHNVLLGEVWICSGQSNMELQLHLLDEWEHLKMGLNDMLKGYQIRLCQIERNISNQPKDDCKAQWAETDSSTLKNFSAVAWYFGWEMARKLHVPVALISSSWGGTPAEAWTENSFLTKDKDLSFYLSKSTEGDLNPSSPSVLYNAMIHPAINYTIKGAIWYQGEANINDADLYTTLFPAMIKSWRAAWNIGDFPFYYVQIAPYIYSRNNTSPYLREAQLKTLSVENTGMAVTMDIGNVNDIHPKNKIDVGKRLSLWALSKTYHQKDVKVYSGPVYKKMKVEGSRVRLYFDYAETGLQAKNDLNGFTIAGEDMNFVAANAVIEGSEVLVSAKTIANPVAVRYAFTDTSSATLFNKEWLPASSFRTDHQVLFCRMASIKFVKDTINENLFAYISGNDANTQIHYTLDGSAPTFNSPIYKDKILLQESVTIKAKVFEGKTPSLYSATSEFHRHNAWKKKVEYINKFSPLYKGTGLTDGIRGSTNFRDGLWQGFLGEDVFVIIDMESSQPIGKINLSFLQDIGSWIFPPLYVDIYVANNKNEFSFYNSINNDTDLTKEGGFLKEFIFDMKHIKARYIKVVAKNMGLCPSWHIGAKNKAWVFIDEIEVD
ncbi:MAG: sialate O-acetylesterase [Bacteroidota bacterium]